MEKKLPNVCPSCGRGLTVRRFECERCGTSVEGAFGLPLLARLSPVDQTLVVSLIKASGSLKELARQYGVSYPTVRNRLDELIGRIEKLESEPIEGGLK
ncbi:MAG: DUF2089 domain-containing protein [bacterium]|nr:DUF2089 domain-containing protein [bacterium]